MSEIQELMNKENSAGYIKETLETAGCYGNCTKFDAIGLPDCKNCSEHKIMSIELELCPFCGETVGIQTITTGDNKDPIGYGSVIKGQILCSSRNCLLEEFSHRKYYSGGFKLQSEDHKNYQREVSEYTATAWNTRVSNQSVHKDELENPPLLDKYLDEEAELIMEAGIKTKLRTANNLFKKIALMTASGNCTKNQIKQIYDLAEKGLKSQN